MKDWLAKLRRIRALTLKETRQVIRDPSSIAIGCVVPLMMILLFGYGLSLDINHVSVAVVDEDDSSDSAALIGAFRLSPYFRVTVVHSMAEASSQMLNTPPAFGRGRSPDSGQWHGREPGAHHARLRPGGGRPVERGAGWIRGRCVRRSGNCC
jgi:hypothetical protein